MIMTNNTRERSRDENGISDEFEMFAHVLSGFVEIEEMARSLPESDHFHQRGRDFGSWMPMPGGRR